MDSRNPIVRAASGGREPPEKRCRGYSGGSRPPLARKRIFMRHLVPLLLAALCPLAATAAETVWIEAEHLRGIKGHCFPDMKGKTNGSWALSGPGIGPEWT